MRIVFILTLLLWPAVILGDPVISSTSGDFSHGQQVTVEGLGFGSKPSPRPYLWDTFEDGVLGAQVLEPIIGAYADDPEDRGNWYSNNDKWSGSQSSMWDSTLPPPSVVQSGGYHMRWSESYGRYGFLSFKWKLESTQGNTYEGIHVKLGRLQSQAQTYTSGVPNWNIGMEYGSTQFQGIGNHGGNGLEPGSQFYFGTLEDHQYTTSEWNDMYMALDCGTMNAANGKMWRANNGNHSQTTGREVLHSSYDATGIRGGLVCALIGNGSYDLVLYLDDIYLDSSLARVVLGNKETWAETTIREMQLPEAWGTGNISITVNTGRFTEGDDAWLYVFDSSGNYNSVGHYILIGEDNSIDPTICSPTNLTEAP